MTDASTVDIDPSDEAPIDEDKLDRIYRLIDAWIDQERVVEEAEESLDSAKRTFARIEADLLDAMDAAHTKLHALDGGEVVEVVRELHASIPKGREPEAIAWMIEDGNGDLVKSTVTLALPRGTIDTLNRIVRSLTRFNAELGDNEKFELSQKLSIHHGTLNKFVRDAVDEQKRTDLPEDLLGVFHRRYARVTRPEAEKL